MDLIGISLSDAGVLAFAALLAGTVRGFAGFGTGLIYVPLASTVLDPVSVVITIVMMDLVGPLPVARKAWPEAHHGDLKRLVLGTALALPVGLVALFAIDPSLFRGLVSTVSLIMLAGLVLGWRYSGALGPKAVFSTGAAAGFLGGLSGLPGPPVIFVYMASHLPPRVIRTNITLFLLGYDWLVVGFLGLAGRLAFGPALLGLLLTVPNLVGNLLGARLFVPAYERLYRAAAYLLIFGAALAGLPVWN